MQVSEAGLQLIKESEGFRSTTYLDAAGIPKAEPAAKRDPLILSPNSPDPSAPGTAGQRAQEQPGSQTIVIPRGSSSVPSNLNQFDPKPRTPPPPALARSRAGRGRTASRRDESRRSARS